jgi:short-subunit dehydrogenase
VDLGVRGRGYLVVGGSAGIGLATAAALAADGAAVAIVGRDAARAARAASTLRSDHAEQVVTLVGDVTVPGEAERLVAEAVAALGACAASP